MIVAADRAKKKRQLDSDKALYSYAVRIAMEALDDPKSKSAIIDAYLERASEFRQQAMKRFFKDPDVTAPRRKVA